MTKTGKEVESKPWGRVKACLCGHRWYRAMYSRLGGQDDPGKLGGKGSRVSGGVGL